MKMRVTKLCDLTNAIVQFSDDARQAEHAVDAEDTQYNRRAMVRALFAMIEGTVFALKQTAFTGGCHKKGALSIADEILLQDLSVDMNSKGESELRTKFVRLEDNLRFAANMLKRIYDVTLDLGIGTKDWEKFIAAITIRNRITHPKSTEDLVIDNEHLLIIREVVSWFCDLIVDALNGITNAVYSPKLQSIADAAKQLSDALKKSDAVKCRGIHRIADDLQRLAESAMSRRFGVARQAATEKAGPSPRRMR